MSHGIDAHTGLLGLLGEPVEHSFSPLFMNLALEKLSLNYRYLAFSVRPADLNAALAGLRALGMRGATVTIPHKQAIIPLLDRIEGEARSIGAVNCIDRRGGELVGTNTDHLGFLKPLADRGFSVEGIRALVLGCGGAARAVVFSLVREKCAGLLLANRRPDRARELIAWSQRELGFQEISYIGPGEKVTQALVDRCSLVVNATPVGMFPRTGNCPVPNAVVFHPHQLIYDLIYNPVETRLLALARSRGSTVINGLEMLVTQGLYALAAWFPQRKERIFSLQHAIISDTRRRLFSEKRPE